MTRGTSNGNRAFVDSVLNDPRNSDNHIYIQLERGTASAIQSGTWRFTLNGTEVVSGDFHAWIERGAAVPRFLPPHVNDSRTISIPGTARIVPVEHSPTRPRLPLPETLS